MRGFDWSKNDVIWIRIGGDIEESLCQHTRAHNLLETKEDVFSSMKNDEEGLCSSE
jgi:hypothetical protein